MEQLEKIKAAVRHYWTSSETCLTAHSSSKLSASTWYEVNIKFVSLVFIFAQDTLSGEVEQKLAEQTKKNQK